MGAGGSPDALVGRLYAGRGRQQRLAESSPPRNTSFGTTTVQNQQCGGSDISESPIGGVSGLIRSRAAAVAATNLIRDEFTEQQQQDLLVPRLHHHPSGLTLLGNGAAAASSAGGLQPQQYGDGINSPPRIGVRRRSSCKSSPARSRSGSTSSTIPNGSSRVAAGCQPRKKQGAAAAHQQQQPSVGGGMMLSRSLGALGQAGAGRSTLAIVNTRDDGAPYLRSERMSPKSSALAATGLSSKRPSPGRESLR